MRRSALRTFIERMVVASLPVAMGAGCMRQCDPGPKPASYTVPATRTIEDDGGQRTIVADGRVLSAEECQLLCVGQEATGRGFGTCETQTNKQGQFVVVCQPFGGDCTGRRPEQFRERGDVGGFARMALLEDASVHAFRRLAAELSAHDAPRSLVAAAKRAARDEVRHARMMAALARRAGQIPMRADAAPLGIRDLESIAAENAIEGCVRETFGALIASWQGRTEPDLVVRRAMAAIAVDETRHAELGWAVDEWIRPRLSAAARTRVDQARSGAVRELLEETRGDSRLHGWAEAAARELWALCA